jgi:hypothetical protein
MSNIKYCNLCDKNVVAVKKAYSMTALIFLLIFALPFGIFYYLHYARKSGNCPVCGNDNLLPLTTKAELLKANKDTEAKEKG